MNISNLKLLSRKIRMHALRMIANTNSSHIGSCFSIADILAILYGSVLTYNVYDPNWSERDRFILSKGHATAILYAVLAEVGFFDLEWLASYNFFGAKLLGHCTAQGVPGVEVSTGALGHGLSIGVGISKALQMDHKASLVYVLIGDGECNEGAIWEAAMLASHLKLSNLCVIIDSNKLQGFGTTQEVINLAPLAEKWRSFNWYTQQVNGHDYEAVLKSFENIKSSDRPNVIIADTIKGKGVSYMENQLVWHYKSPSPTQLAMALKEIEAFYEK